ncbi:DNA-directed RNA polymerase specialized sigma54-like protein [Mesorhizobium sp. USDA 4775]
MKGPPPKPSQGFRAMQTTATLIQHQKQSMVLSRKIIESIGLLRLSLTELQQFVDQAVAENPVLDRAPTDGEASGDDWSISGGDPRTGSRGKDVADSPARFGRGINTTNKPAGDRPDLDKANSYTETLRDHVARQIAGTAFTPRERLIALGLAAPLEETEYLHVDFLELAGRLNVQEADVERVLGTMQQFDPSGIFARTLSECLAIQLRNLERFDPAMEVLELCWNLGDEADQAALCGFNSMTSIPSWNLAPAMSFGN